ncbi:o-succinylbenzoate synthase [Planococcus shenhongbingii]|uniref:o-succinylbenzoate synthase n=1 Tax=Planococcus shenhongbingii TaxID=3058398 RepID=A0ABT8NDW2_9BACL|nr:o-succinylbenzoate synthase [Planococcus sp. N017]MDN7246084.1 o-succinylbenzoate synthase [Planococcus sp. N017]
MELTIAGIELREVNKPLKRPFKTSLQTVEERESLIVKVTDAEGVKGYGECVAFSTPWYTEETVVSSRFVIEKVLVPILLHQSLKHPGHVNRMFQQVKGNRMAKAAIEMAVWDLFAKKKDIPLWKMVGGEERAIPAGVVVAADPEKVEEQVAEAVSAGYSRIKIKISPDSDLDMLAGIIRKYPNQLFFADANGAFAEETFDKLLELDQAGFTLIEQPFGEQQWQLHTKAKKAMNTAICLDESISSIEDVQRMIDEQAGDMIVLKMGRLGGWSEALKVARLCRTHSIGMWVGGMIEFGVSKAHNLALASLPGITLPGDFSDSQHFWNEDIIIPEIIVENGEIELSVESGIGYQVKL